MCGAIVEWVCLEGNSRSRANGWFGPTGGVLGATVGVAVKVVVPMK
jgi:hypothetical protein